MFCPFCGKANSVGWVFCSGCGRQIPTEPTAVTAVPQEPAFQPQSAFESATTGTVFPIAQPRPQTIVEATEEVWTDTPTPWRRYFARMIDILGWAFIFGAVLTLVGVDTKNMNDIGLGLVLLALWVPAEAILLATCGNTFGKWLLALKVRLPNDSSFGFDTAIRRSALVWVKGLWFGLPLVTLVGLISSYNTLKSHGATSWDVTCSTAVLHSRMDGKRIAALAGMILLACIILILVIASE